MSRKAHQESNYGAVTDEQTLDRIQKEIIRLHPKVEVTIEGLNEIAKGIIREWFPKRKFFAVEWTKLPRNFILQSDTNSELRVYFKVNLFTTQIIFKSSTLRRMNSSSSGKTVTIFHYRIPENIYQQQGRGALRVPIYKKSAMLETTEGKYEILDLSVTGAKLRPLGDAKIPNIGKEWKSPVLWFKNHQVSGENFQVKVTRKAEDEFAVQFSKITDHERIQIKQFLIEALKTFYDKAT
jgi:hypothetical protein